MKFILNLHFINSILCIVCLIWDNCTPFSPMSFCTTSLHLSYGLPLFQSLFTTVVLTTIEKGTVLLGGKDHFRARYYVLHYRNIIED